MTTDWTDNGVPITIGLRVLTNDWRWGTVVEEPPSWTPGWWRVRTDGNRYTDGYNGERMTTRPPAGAPRDPYVQALIVAQTDADVMGLPQTVWYDPLADGRATPHFRTEIPALLDDDRGDLLVTVLPTQYHHRRTA